MKNSMRKRINKSIALLAAIIMTFTLLPLTAHAEGNTTIHISPENPKVGDTVTVTVKGSASDTISVTYSSSVLKITDAGGATSEANKLVFTGTQGKFTFTATAEGKGYVSVSATNLAGSSVALKVGNGTGESTESQTQTTEQTTTTQTTEQPAQPAETAQPEQPAETAEPAEPVTTQPSGNGIGTHDPNVEGDYAINGFGYVISERYTAEEVPAGFEKTQVVFHGTDVYKEPKNDSMTLVYLKPHDNIQGSGVFYIYDEASDTVSPLNLFGTMSNYVIALSPDDLPSLLLKENTRLIGDKEMPCYNIEGMEESEFTYVYGMNQNQEKMWFMVDTVTGTVSRADTDVLSQIIAEDEITDNGDGDKDKDKEEKKEFDFKEFWGQYGNLILIGLFALIVIMIIVVNIRMFRDRAEEEDWEFDPKDEEEDKPTKKELKRAERERKREEKEERKAEAYVAKEEARALKEQEEYEDDYDEDEEDEDDDEDEKPRRKGFFARIFEDDDDDEDDDYGEEDDNEEVEELSVKEAREKKRAQFKRPGDAEPQKEVSDETLTNLTAALEEEAAQEEKQERKELAEESKATILTQETKRVEKPAEAVPAGSAMDMYKTGSVPADNIEAALEAELQQKFKAEEEAVKAVAKPVAPKPKPNDADAIADEAVKAIADVNIIDFNDL